jgi:hypothetical protein
VRLRITRALSGSIDGIQLAYFTVGQVYDVGTSVGSLLLSVRAAEPVSDSEPVDEIGLSRPDWRDQAADSPPKKSRDNG